MASENVKLLIHTAEKHPEAAPSAQVRPEKQPKPRRVRLHIDMRDRLLRNGCIACALLLSILALKTLPTPWAKNVSSTISRALTMRIDLDQSIGQLSFVQRLMPDSALVFLNLDGRSDMSAPVQGDIAHPYSAEQPWMMFSAAGNTDVRAAADGVVSAVSRLSDGTVGILIDHGNGVETVTANLRETDLQAGAAVSRGDKIGTADRDVYFELRRGGESADPAELLGL